MNRNTQTAAEIGQEYSTKLNALAESYERMTGHALSTNDQFFWESSAVQWAETLAIFWWQISRYNNPVDYAEGDYQ